MYRINTFIVNVFSKINLSDFLDYWQTIVDQYPLLIIVICFMLPFIEAIFPILPIVAFIAFNMQNLGLLGGFVVTVLGSTIGTYLVFLILNLSFGKKIRKRIERNPDVLRASSWLEKKGFVFCSLAMGNPFMPTSIFNYAFSLTMINRKKYFFIVLTSRILLVGVLTLLGAAFSIEENPIAVLWVLLVYVAAYMFYILLMKFIKYIKIKKRRKNMSKKIITDVDLKGKTVLIRVDFNVPMKDGEITNDNRIVQALPTIKYAKEQGAKLVLFSHLGRIKEESDKVKGSMVAVAKRLSDLLEEKVVFVPETRGEKLEKAIKDLQAGEVLMFENTRFEDVPGKKESKNDPELGKYWASLGDVFVNDAFGTAHRAHASNVGIASNIKEAVAGFLMEKEIKFIGEAVDNPEKPFVAILGGAKVSDKISVIENLIKKADKILVCGAMAYTFYKAQGYEIGTSLVEEDFVEYAKELLVKAKGKIILPIDNVIAKEFSATAASEVVLTEEMPADQMGLDIGPKTIELFEKELKGAKTVVWNGPAGVFEFEKFAVGTKAICRILAELEGATTIIGGGDSAAAAIQMGYEDKVTHISTGGGASLEYLEGKELPGIASINNK